MSKQPWFWPFAVVACGCFLYSVTGGDNPTEGKAITGKSDSKSKTVSSLFQSVKPASSTPQTAAAPSSTSGDDSTIVVPKDAENKGKHPYYPPSSSEKQSAVGNANNLLSKYTEEQWLNLVPKQSPRTVFNDPPDGSKDWVWDPTKPEQIKTQKGLVLPGQYPVKVKSAKVMSGKTVNVPSVFDCRQQVPIWGRNTHPRHSFL